MSWVWNLPLSPGGWKCSDSQFLLQYPSFLGVCFPPIILLNFALVHVRCLQWLLNKQINAIVFDSYGLDSASQTSSKVVYGRESNVPHPLFLAVFYCIYFSFPFFFSILFFYFIFLFIHLASIFSLPRLPKGCPHFTTCFWKDLLWKSIHIHPSEKLQEVSQKGVLWGVQLLSSPRKTNSSALWNRLS